MDNRKYLPIIVIVGIGILVIALFSSSMFVTIQAGEAGVLFRKFSGGLDKDMVYGQGFQLIAPWNDMHVYDIKEQTAEESMDVLDKNGLSISVDVTVRYNPIPGRIGYIHERFGKSYKNTLIIPEIRSIVRQVMGRFTAEEIYSTKRADVESSIKSETAEVLGNENNNINMNAMLIRSINLPEQIKTAIENKLREEQEALAYKFRLDKEKSEAERKRIAAEGEARANKIINSSLTRELLRMRGIEATTQLANSENSKVIVIGSGDGGLPLILGSN